MATKKSNPEEVSAQKAQPKKFTDLRIAVNEFLKHGQEYLDKIQHAANTENRLKYELQETSLLEDNGAFYIADGPYTIADGKARPIIKLSLKIYSNIIPYGSK